MTKGLIIISMVALTMGFVAGITEASPPNEKTSDLVIKITGFESADGVARIMLVNSKESFDNQSAFKVIRTAIIDREVMQTVNVPYGEYAIRVYHDENDNGTLDRMMFGIPKEKYGFSNNVRSAFGPPAYEDAAFKISTPKSAMTVNVK